MLDNTSSQNGRSLEQWVNPSTGFLSRGNFGAVHKPRHGIDAKARTQRRLLTVLASFSVLASIAFIIVGVHCRITSGSESIAHSLTRRLASEGSGEGREEAGSQGTSICKELNAAGGEEEGAESGGAAAPPLAPATPQGAPQPRKRPREVDGEEGTQEGKKAKGRRSKQSPASSTQQTKNVSFCFISVLELCSCCLPVFQLRPPPAAMKRIQKMRNLYGE